MKEFLFNLLDRNTKAEKSGARGAPAAEPGNSIIKGCSNVPCHVVFVVFV